MTNVAQPRRGEQETPPGARAAGSLAERSVLSDRRVAEALAALHRAVAASQFYPEGHPMLLEAVQEGYRAFLGVESDYRWEAPGLQLRSGALWFGHSRLGEGSPAVGTLARTFSGHGLTVVRRREPVSSQAFGALVALLATSPDVLAPRGGLAQVWEGSPGGECLELRGLALSAGTGAGEGAGPGGARPEEGSWGAGLRPGLEAELLAEPRLLRRLQAFLQRGPRERRLLDLLLRLGRTEDVAAFLDLLREISRLVEGYLDVERYREAYQVVLFLYREAQNLEAARQEGRRDYLLDTIRLTVRGPFLQWLIELVANGGKEEEAELGEYVLRALGKAGVVPVINALITEGSRLGRRRLVDVLVSIGDAVVPWAAKMLEDQRWFVVRNMATVLGGIGSPDAQRVLARLAGDPDPRIRKEVARAFSRASGPVAEEQVLRLMADPEPAVRLMAISAAAAHRSERVLRALEAAFRDTAIGSPEWNLKAGALRALGRLGLPGGVGVLAGVVRKRPLLRRKRWHALKRAAIQALGHLGGEEAVALLGELRHHRDVELRTEALRALALVSGGAERR